MDDILEGSAGGARSYGGNKTNCWLVVLRTGDYQWLGVSHCLLRREGGGGLMETGISSRFESSGVVSRLMRLPLTCYENGTWRVLPSSQQKAISCLMDLDPDDPWPN